MSDMPETTSSSNVVDYLLNAIGDGTFNPGEKLPPERDLSAQLSVSRNTVREAIKVMNYLGFIDSTQGSGNYIANAYDHAVSSIMKVLYMRNEISFLNVTDFRRMLELQSFELAITHATHAQKLEMRNTVDLLDSCTDPAQIVTLDNRFHTILTEASHNKLIIIIYVALSKVIDEYMRETYLRVTKHAQGFAELQTYHHAIVDALFEKDAEKGRQAIIDHFNLLIR